MPNNQKCINCKYSISFQPNDIYGRPKKELLYFCRRNPPTTAGFPQVETEWWCGEYKSEEPKGEV